MLARDIMSTDVLSVSPDKDFNHVEVVAELKHVRHVPVVDGNNEVMGVVSVRDLLSHLTVAGASHFIPIREVMSQSLVSAEPDTPLENLVDLMRQHQVGFVPIVEQGELVGVVSDRDFLKVVKPA